MRVRSRLLLVSYLSSLLVPACTAPSPEGAALAFPVSGAPTPAAHSPEATPVPRAAAVLQVVPPGDDVHWGGGGTAFAITGRGCETSIVDAVAGRVTARLAGCRVWPSPARDAFLVLTDEAHLVVWDGRGRRGPEISASFRIDRTPAWSPDGARVALVTDDLVQIVDPTTGDTVAAVRGPTGVGAELSWRADGRLLAAHGRKEVWTFEEQEGLPAALTVKAVSTGCVTVQQAKFAPRGDVLAVRCDEDFGELWDTRTARLVTATRRVRDWSATGRHVTVLAPAAEVHEAASDAVELRPQAATYDRLEYSPDDAWLASDVSVGSAPSVDVWSLATGQRVLRLRGMTDPRWSADGAYLSVRSDEPDAPALVVLAAGSWKEVWRRHDVAHGAWSTVGAGLAVTSVAGGLELLDARTATARPMPSATTGWFARLYQAPDGALMAPMVPRGDGRGQAVRVSADGGATVVDVPAEAVNPWWSPDGARVVRNRAVSRMPMAMATFRLVVEDLTTGEHAFLDGGYGGVDARWSARGHRLLVMNRESLFFDTDARRVWRVPAKQPTVAALDADGTRAALQTADGLEVFALASKEPPVPFGPADHTPPSFLALAGNRLAAVRRDGEVRVWNVKSRELLASWSAGFVPEHVAWVGEGERLALSRRDVLRLANADGSEAVTVTALRSGASATLLTEAVPP